MFSRNGRGVAKSAAVIVLGLAVGAAVTVSAGQLMAISNGDVDISADEGSDPATPANTETQSESGIDEQEIEMAVHQTVNEIRESEGLPQLRYDDRLHRIADGHSEDMAERGYFSHESPNGSSFEDRYLEQGYNCEVAISSTEYATGAENIAYTYAYSDINQGNEIVNYNGNETRIGIGLVSQWMDSPGHRENILKEYWRSEGIGISVDEEDGQTKIYATQNFC